MPGLLRPLGASIFLARGSGTVLDPPPLGRAGALALDPSLVTWAMTSLGMWFFLLYGWRSNSILALRDRGFYTLTPSFCLPGGLTTLALPSAFDL